MKKFVTLFICAAIVLSMAACGTGGKKPEAEQKPGDTMSLEEIFETILKDVSDLPAAENIAITEENFESFLFIPAIKDAQALASEGLISSVAHSAVLSRVPEGTDAEKVAQDIKAAANPTKWVCVTAEKTTVSVHGNTILLVMSFTDTADAITKNFDSLWA